jgi:hypothetical protein
MEKNQHESIFAKPSAYKNVNSSGSIKINHVEPLISGIKSMQIIDTSVGK